MMILLAREPNCDYESFKVVLPGKSTTLPPMGVLSLGGKMLVFHAAHVGLLVIGNSPIHKSMFLKLSSRSESWVDEFGCLWWVMRIYDEYWWFYDDLWDFTYVFLSIILWEVWIMKFKPCESSFSVRMFYEIKDIIQIIACTPIYSVNYEESWWVM